MKISEQLLNTIVGYLAKQPFAEVAQLINAIQLEIQAQAEKPQEQ